MRSLCCTTLFLTLAGLGFADDKIDAAKLVGKWEDKNPPKGETSTAEFTKDGNVRLVRILRGKKEIALEGTYKLEGDKLTMKVHPGGKKKTTDKVVTVDKLTDDEFVQTDEEKTTKTFRRVKAAETTPDASKTETPMAETPPEPLPKVTLPAPDFKLTAGEYLKEFKDNEEAAKKKYKGKIVELSGKVVLAFGPLPGEKTSSLSIATPDPKTPLLADSVICISNDPEFFARVGNGQTIRIRGKVNKDADWLESSELVERGPDTRVLITAEALASDFTADKDKARKKYLDKTLVLTGTIAAIKQEKETKEKYLELKGDGKTVIECHYLLPERVEKYKVGQTVKVYSSVWNIDNSTVTVPSCEPLPTLAGASKTDAPGTGSLPTDPLPKVTLPAPDFKLTADEYMDEYRKDGKAAQKKYQGKIVELSGKVVTGSGPMIDKTSSVSIGTPDPKNLIRGIGVLCISNDPEFFARVGVGQTVSIRGKVHKDFKWLESSELVERGPDTRIFVTSEVLAKDFTIDKEKARKKYAEKTLVLSGPIAAIKEDKETKTHYVELKGDGKTVIACYYLDPDLPKKYKVGQAVKVYSTQWISEGSTVSAGYSQPLPTK